MSPTTQTLKRATLLCCSLLSAAGAQAQPTATAPWPVQPVRLLVGFTAGGPTDIVARALAEPLGKGLGQPVIVDNRPGANAIIAAQAVAQSKDGHTLLMAATNHTMISAMYSRQIQFDPVKSFKAVCRIGASPTVLVVGPQAGLQRLGDFLAKAKSQARAVTYASPGQGSSVHFAGEDFAQRAGVQLTHVPYKGAAPALPQVPTFEESGIKGYRADAWYGVLAPAQTPEAVLQKLQTEVSRFVTSSAGADRLQQLGMDPMLACGDEFDRQIAAETAHWSQLARQLKINDD